ncbi:hypothetical protein INR49_018507, partial [Caranx melampygus]
LQVQVTPSTNRRDWAELKCFSSCRPPDHSSFTWYKNGQKTGRETPSFSAYFDPSDSFSCALKGHEDFPSPPVSLELQVTRTITVHQSHTEAELKCLSSCSPADGLSYVWIRNGEKIMKEGSSYTDWFSPGDVVSCAVKGHESHGSPPVYFLKVPSVSVNPPGEIMEGSSVTLTCSSDTDSAAKYTWYKENLTLLNKEPQLVFSSIQSSDSGEYHCAAENQLERRTSEHISIDVEYAPKLPSVSVSPSAEIVEGSSVTLTCSSDANPAANYTWYKED